MKQCSFDARSQRPPRQLGRSIGSLRGEHMHRLKDKVAIVTGSSSGIGKAIALRFGAEGMKVVVTARRMVLCEQTVAQIKRKGGEAWAIQTDVADEHQVERLIQETVKRYGRLDILV